MGWGKPIVQTSVETLAGPMVLLVNNAMSAACSTSIHVSHHHAKHQDPEETSTIEEGRHEVRRHR